jgi:AraC-like DNA-binding protein
MRTELQHLQRYFQDTLGIKVAPAPWRMAERLPPFLNERYVFAQVEILGTRCVLVIDDKPAEESPAAVRKHLQMLGTQHEGPAIYVRARVSAYNRKRLIEQKVPFVVPGNQMYLPMFAVDLREHFRQARGETQVLSPATHVVVIHALLHNATDGLVPLELARRFGYSPMTMTRAFNELEAAHLGVTTLRDRKRVLHLTGPRQKIWDDALPFLQNPTKKRVWIDRGARLGGVRAGLTALAHYSMLSPPENPTWAVTGPQWHDFRNRHAVVEVPEGDPEGQEIQVWGYDPTLFAQGEVVDPLSLYLTLKGDADERIQAALEEMMRRLEW